MQHAAERNVHAEENTYNIIHGTNVSSISHLPFAFVIAT